MAAVQGGGGAISRRPPPPPGGKASGAGFDRSKARASTAPLPPPPGKASGAVDLSAAARNWLDGPGKGGVLGVGSHTRRRTPAENAAGVAALEKQVAWINRKTGLGGNVDPYVKLAKDFYDVGRYAHPGAEREFVNAITAKLDAYSATAFGDPPGYAAWVAKTRASARAGRGR